MSELGAFLRELRINSGYTLEYVASEINLSKNSISKIELHGYCRIKSIFMLADFYDIRVHQLFEHIE